MVSIENERTRVRAETHDGVVIVFFDSRLPDGGWRLLAGTGLVRDPQRVSFKKWTSLCSDLVLEWREGAADAPLQSRQGLFTEAALADEGRSLKLTGSVGSHHLEMTIELQDEDRAHVEVCDRIAGAAGAVRIGRLMSNLFFTPDGREDRSTEPLEFAWMPNLHRSENGVCGDHFFRSPALIACVEGMYLALAPDLDVFRDHPSLPHALDLRTFGGGVTPSARLEAPRFLYGLCPYEMEPHTYTVHRPEHTEEAKTPELRYAFDVFVGFSPSYEAVAQKVSSFLWSRYGKRYLKDIRPQVLPFGEYGRRYTYVHELPLSVCRDEINGKKCAGINNVHRRGANFHGWENDLNVAFGIKHYAAKWKDPQLEETADGILQLILQSPRNGGAFPCIYNFKDRRYEGTLFWTARAADFLDGYDNAAMGVTAWWMLYWAEQFGMRPEIRELLEGYAEFLRGRQMPSGAIPTYFFHDLSSARQLRESATTALCGAVLAKLAKLNGNAADCKAAVLAGKYVLREIVPGLLFNDFEAYYSCSPKPLHAVDYWNGIRPHCNLSLQWACDQMLALHRLTGGRKWLAAGEYLLSVLSLYQQVWPPSHLRGYLYGGFGVMNTDGEWNDGRQARFTPTYADYYLATGDLECLERAVAACRSSFALMDIPENHANSINDQVLGKNLHGGGAAQGQGKPGMGIASENIYHGGHADDGGGWTGMNWSAGGGLAASAYLERAFGSVWVDVARKAVVPIDGVALAGANWKAGRLELRLKSALRELPHPYADPLPATVRFGARRPAELRVVINDRDFGSPTPAQLQEGLNVTL